MSVASSVALALAARVERAGGPRAGLAAWRALSADYVDVELRAKALIAALGCAVALRDLEALGELSGRWERVDRGVWDMPIASLCKEMTRPTAVGEPAEPELVQRAIALARAEVRRHRTGRSLYLYARCLELGSESSAASIFCDAIERAEKEGSAEISASSRVRRAAILARSWSTMREAAEEARRVHLPRVTPASRIVVARVLLLSPSRFTRASALGTLDEIVRGEDARLAYQALMTAAQWADDMGDALTALELDRLIALFARARATEASPGAETIARAIERIIRARGDELDSALEEAAKNAPPSAVAGPWRIGSLNARARDILGGRFEAPRDDVESAPADPALRRVYHHGLVLDVVAAMRDRAPARAARALDTLVLAEEAGDRLPRELLAVAHAALVSDDAELREVAARFFDVRLSRVRPGAPPRGFLALADALAACGKQDAASLARHAAVFAQEPGALESLGASLARSGWEHARSGDRTRAVEKLREARALFASRDR